MKSFLVFAACILAAWYLSAGFLHSHDPILMIVLGCRFRASTVIGAIIGLYLAGKIRQ